MDGRYATVAEVRLALRAPTNAASTTWADGTTFDTPISRHIKTAEAWIDAHCRQRFDAAGESATVRSFRVRGGGLLLTDPAASSTATVTLDEQTLTAWEWVSDETSRGGVCRHISLDHPPKYGVEVKVSTRWGWPEVPAGIKTATIDLAAHWFSMEENISRAQSQSSLYQPSVPYRLRPILTQFRAPALA